MKPKLFETKVNFHSSILLIVQYKYQFVVVVVIYFAYEVTCFIDFIAFPLVMCCSIQEQTELAVDLLALSTINFYISKVNFNTHFQSQHNLNMTHSTCQPTCLSLFWGAHLFALLRVILCKMRTRFRTNNFIILCCF